MTATAASPSSSRAARSGRAVTAPGLGITLRPGSGSRDLHTLAVVAERHVVGDVLSGAEEDAGDLHRDGVALLVHADRGLVGLLGARARDDLLDRGAGQGAGVGGQDLVPGPGVLALLQPVELGQQRR